MLSYAALHALCHEVDLALDDFILVKVREVGEKKWIFHFEKQGWKRDLLVCAQVPLSRFHLSTSRFEEKTTDFTRAVESRVKGSKCIKIEMLNRDRILSVTFQGDQHLVLFLAELCFKHPKVVLVTPSFQILTSWEPLADPTYRFPACTYTHREEEEIKIDSFSVEKRYTSLEQSHLFNHNLSAARRQLEHRRKKAWERVALYRKEIEEAQGASEQAHIATLLHCSFPLLKRGMRSITVEDWERGGETREIVLDPSLEPHEIVKRGFKHARKLERKGEMASLLLQKAEQEVAVLSAYCDRLNAVTSQGELDVLIEEAQLSGKLHEEKKGIKKRHPYREFCTEAGLLLLVGRNDRENERLSFAFAHGKDRWFHVTHAAGAHVVLRVPKGKEVDRESLEDALQLALYFSKARNRGEEVIMTECKYLSKANRPGQVHVRKYTTFHVVAKPERLQRLLGKLLP